MRAIGSYSETEIWGFTPRKIAALLFIAGKRREADDRRMLALYAMAARGDIKDLRKALKDPDE